MTANWLILSATLPTTPSGLPGRVWRTLTATGAGTLREGVRLLSAHTITQMGADAHLLALQTPHDD
jgi:hypothetical protein